MTYTTNIVGSITEDLAISENLLDRSGNALLGSDFPAFAACFQFPNDVETFNGIKRFETEADLRVTYDNLLLHFRRNGVTHMERSILESSFRGANTISCTHQSRLFNRTNLIQRAYPVFSLLTRQPDATWKISYGSYGLMEKPETAEAVTADLITRVTPLD